MPALHGGGSWAQLPNTGSTATSFTVTGLTSQMGYIFEVAAINAAGASAWSQASPLLQPLLDPGAVTDVVAAPAYQAVALTWFPPANTAIPVTGYVVRWSDDSGTTWNTPLATCSTAAQFTYPGLTQPVPLVFQVAAVNANGQGPWSTASAPATPDTVPAAPSRLRALAGDGAVLLSWNPPADLAGGTLSGYRIEYQVGSGTEWIVHTASTGTTATQFAIVNLVNGTSYRLTYTVQVAAATGAGQGAWSTMLSQPSAVPSIGVQSMPGGRIRLVWTAPANTGGSPINGYRIWMSTNGGAWVAQQINRTGRTTVVIGGLSRLATYRFMIQPLSAAWPGTIPAPTRAVRPG